MEVTKQFPQIPMMQIPLCKGKIRGDRCLSTDKDPGPSSHNLASAPETVLLALPFLSPEVTSPSLLVSMSVKKARAWHSEKKAHPITKGEYSFPYMHACSVAQLCLTL